MKIILSLTILAALPLGQLSAALIGLGSINGFGDGTGWSLNAGPTQPGSPPVISGGELTLTFDGTGGDANSAFFSTKQDIRRFAAEFDYQLQFSDGPFNPADGFSLVIQNDALDAVGGTGGDLGVYGNPSTQILNSAALSLSLFLPDGVAAGTGDAKPTIFDFEGTAPVDVELQNTVHFSIVYDGAALAVTMEDLTTGDVFSTSFDIHVPTAVGGGTAWVGFTGSTGGGSSTQTISNFLFIPEPGTGLLLGLALIPVLMRRCRS